MRRALHSLVAVLAATVALTGCIKFDTDLTIADDGTVDGAVVVAFSKRFLDLPGIGELFEGLTEVAPDEQPSTGRVTTRPYEDDDFRGVELVLDDVPIDEIGGAVGADSGAGPTDTDIRIVRAGDTFRFSGMLDLRGDAGEDLPDVPGADALLGSAEVRVEVTFPGDVIEANGDVDGRTVRWTPDLGERVEMEAVGSAVPGGGSGFPWLAVTAAGLGVAALGIGGVLLARRGRRSSPPPPPPPPPAGLGGPPPPLPTPGAGLPTPVREGRPLEAPDGPPADPNRPPPGGLLPPPPSGTIPGPPPA